MRPNRKSHCNEPVFVEWHIPSLRSYFSPNLTLFVGFIQGGTGKLFIVPSFHPTFFSISLFSPPKVQPSAGTCQKPTPWSAWPTTTMKRTPSLAKWPRRRRSSAGGWRTNWKVPALSASPQPTPLAHSHGTNPAPPSPVPAPTIMRAPSTERLSCWLTFAVCKKRCGAQCQICTVLCYTHTGPAVDMVHYQCSLVSFVFVFFTRIPNCGVAVWH